MKEEGNTQSVAETPKKSARGGARAGSGRKKLNPADKKVTMGVQVRPAIKEQYMELKKRGIDVNERIEAEISKLAKVFGVK